MARILLADDDKTVRDLVRRAIEAGGHTVTLAEDGAEAAAAFETGGGAFDLIVSDIEMPGLDGLALTARAIQASPRVRILLMSGYPSSLEQGKALAPARIVTIAKPFTLDDMRRAIAAALG